MARPNLEPAADAAPQQSDAISDAKTKAVLIFLHLKQVWSSMEAACESDLNQKPGVLFANNNLLVRW